MLLTGIWINNVGFDCNNEIPYLSNTFNNLLFPATEPIFIRMSFDKSKQLITYNHINGVGLFLIWILWRHFWCTDIKHEFKNRDKCTKKTTITIAIPKLFVTILCSLSFIETANIHYMILFWYRKNRCKLNLRSYKNKQYFDGVL